MDTAVVLAYARQDAKKGVRHEGRGKNGIKEPWIGETHIVNNVEKESEQVVVKQWGRMKTLKYQFMEH